MGLVLMLIIGVLSVVCFALSWYFCARGRVHKDEVSSQHKLNVRRSEESEEKKESASETDVYSDEETDYDLSVKAMAHENVPLVLLHPDSAADDEL